MLALLRIAGVVVAALVVASGAFLAGRFTSSAADPTSACIDAREVVRKANDDALAAGGDERIGHARLAANAILQNPDCFGAHERATAQAALDVLNAPQPQGPDSIDSFLLD
jgi:hypothetical protein